MAQLLSELVLGSLVAALALCLHASRNDHLFIPAGAAGHPLATQRSASVADLSSKAKNVATGMERSAVLAALICGVGCLRASRRSAVTRHGLSDRQKKDFSTKSAMIKKLGKLVLMKEFDMRNQIKDDPKLALRSGVSQDQLLADFERAVGYLRTELKMDGLSSDVAVSKVATGLYMQHLGRPAIPSNEHMATVINWLEANLDVDIESGGMARVVEQYPFVLGRSLEELEESKRFCPDDINYEVAVADDPALIDKTYNCDGICANQCVACWYNG